MHDSDAAVEQTLLGAETSSQSSSGSQEQPPSTLLGLAGDAFLGSTISFTIPTVAPRLFFNGVQLENLHRLRRAIRNSDSDVQAKSLRDIAEALEQVRAGCTSRETHRRGVPR